MDLLLDIYTKNGGHLKQVAASSPAVPRVGEYIDPPDNLLEWTQRLPLLVTHVRYQLQDTTLIPMVTCHARGDDSSSHRLLLLEDEGWLQPRE